MPYKITKDGDKFCVVKADSGETMKCYPSEDEAKKYLGALESNADETKSADKAGAQLSKGNAGMVADMLKMGHSLLKKTGMGHMIPSVDEEYGAGDEGSPEEEASESDSEAAAEGDTPTNKKKSLLQAAKDLLLGTKDLKAQGFQPIGENGWVAWWSNNFEDREKELFPEKALDAYIWRVDKGLVPKPDLWFWHMPGAKSGQAEWVDRIGHLMVAVGAFDTSEVGQAAKAGYQNSKETYAVSHGFTFPSWALKDGAYEEFNTFEISPLPLASAANSFTLFQEIKAMGITAEKQAALEKLVGKDIADKIVKSSETASKEIEALGARFKDVANPNAKPAPAADSSPLADLTVRLIEDNAILLNAVTGLEKQLADERTANKKELDALKTAHKEVTDEWADIRKQMDLKPRRPSVDALTALNPDMFPQDNETQQLIKALRDKMAKDSAKYDPFFGVEVKG